MGISGRNEQYTTALAPDDCSGKDVSCFDGDDDDDDDDDDAVVG